MTPSPNSGWMPIADAPFQTAIEVRNPRMEFPVLATRGYAADGMVHPDSTYCTSVFTPDPRDAGLPFYAGRLVCPTEYRMPIPPVPESE